MNHNRINRYQKCQLIIIYIYIIQYNIYLNMKAQKVLQQSPTWEDSSKCWRSSKSLLVSSTRLNGFATSASFVHSNQLPLSFGLLTWLGGPRSQFSINSMSRKITKQNTNGRSLLSNIVFDVFVLGIALAQVPKQSSQTFVLNLTRDYQLGPWAAWNILPISFEMTVQSRKRPPQVLASFSQLGVSENVVDPIVPNGFADHYPY